MAQSVLEAFEHRDVNRLRGLALTEQEFRDHVWPELPSARPERNLPFSYVWADLRQKSEQSLAATLEREGGRRYTLVSVRFGGEATNYPSYVVNRETVLRVRENGGATQELKFFGSTIEKDQGWKVFSYVADD